jgi:hypothetical protein
MSAYSARAYCLRPQLTLISAYSARIVPPALQLPLISAYSARMRTACVYS